MAPLSRTLACSAVCIVANAGAHVFAYALKKSHPLASLLFRKSHVKININVTITFVIAEMGYFLAVCRAPIM